MSDIIFKPWIGKEYNKGGGIFGKKILVIGHCHYTEANSFIVESNTSSDLSSIIIHEYLYLRDTYPKGTGNWFKTYSNFEKALIDKEPSDDDKIKIWNSIAFYNYLQIMVNKPLGTTIPKKYYLAAEEPFFEVLNQYKPDLIIVWGNDCNKGLWKNMPHDVSKCICYNDNECVRDYLLKNGTPIKTIAIHHPCMGFSPSYWYGIIRKYL